MTRARANEVLAEIAQLAGEAQELSGAERRNRCLELAWRAVDCLAWAGIETSTRRGERDDASALV